jgi:hypothetical protein
MTALRSFLDEVRAQPQVRAARAANAVLQGELAGVKVEPLPAADYLARLDWFVDVSECSDDATVIENSDGLRKIVTRDAPVRERLFEFLEFLKAHDPRPRQQ